MPPSAAEPAEATSPEAARPGQGNPGTVRSDASEAGDAGASEAGDEHPPAGADDPFARASAPDYAVAESTRSSRARALHLEAGAALPEETSFLAGLVRSAESALGFRAAPLTRPVATTPGFLVDPADVPATTGPALPAPTAFRTGPEHPRAAQAGRVGHPGQDAYAGLTAQGAAAQGPIAQGPIAQGPIAQGPIAQGPIAQGPIAQGPIAQGPAPQHPADHQPRVPQRPAAQRPAAQRPAAQRPAAQTPAAAQPPAPHHPAPHHPASHHPAPPRSPAQRPAATRTLPLRPTPLLMQGQEYLFRTQPKCLDFQEQAHRLGVVDEGDGSPVPCVLVLARSADMEMNELSIALAERGIRMVRIDADRCTDLPLTVYTDTPLLELDRWLVRPLLVWRRHFELSAVPVEPGTLAGAYAVDQWNAVAGWLSTRRDWAHVNPVRHTAHLDRLTQMADAAAFGLTVPRTAVTTRPGRTRPGGGQCIVKTAGRHLLEPRPGVQHGLFPRPLETSRAGDVPETAPVIVQEYVTAETEIRVFTVDEECLAYQVDKIDPAQLWVDPDAVRVTPVEVPEGLRGRLLALARHWRLQVAAFDLLVAGDDHVFLEVNVNCDWRWFEHRAGDTRVSDAVHSWVAGRFEELLGAGQGR
ncbi:hypothetical protein [Actinosynnema mirum]|uniref:RimK domain protein ATP-grasp n=1 Tax=Actinosynnema mirum (strain ATCC 29888 / DSM 43827 / JCM 3225 / NBRC 14064 / NCIMB 13271 / NRRL B-12336 / IMRU 3971 / 101) TaxID=446462 RepID=C6WKP8_ACTMD|nr:hypothetical protein [Actinosynnema mirum]ACU34653.1 hypothetical protein Amir_0690 [Actinosynnema mirum DSM 43827]